jgi:hypothetical protein
LYLLPLQRPGHNLFVVASSDVQKLKRATAVNRKLSLGYNMETNSTTQSDKRGDDLRIKPDYDMRKILDYMTSKQIEKLHRFRESIPQIWPEKLTARELLFLTDATLARYLRAREFKLKKAQQMLVNTLKWRREYKPHRITVNDIKIELKNNGKLYRNGVDKWGRPLIYMKPRHDNTGAPEREVKVKSIVYLLELVTRESEERRGREKVTLLIDFRDAKHVTSIANVRVSIDFLKVLQNHYPERLGVALIVNAPWAWQVFWKLISPFMDEVTKKKVLLLKSYAQLKEYIDDENLEEDYGGTNTFKYDYRQYKKTMHKLWLYYQKKDLESIRELEEKDPNLEHESSSISLNENSSAQSFDDANNNQDNKKSEITGANCNNENQAHNNSDGNESEEEQQKSNDEKSSRQKADMN